MAPASAAAAEPLRTRNTDTRERKHTRDKGDAMSVKSESSAVRPFTFKFPEAELSEIGELHG
jgi:hypothetical protein